MPQPQDAALLSAYKAKIERGEISEGSLEPERASA